jgi:hypothetical protein
MIPVRRVAAVRYSDCGREFLARGAQQQAAQREERQGKEGGEEHGLMHEGHYSLKNLARANFSRAGML